MPLLGRILDHFPRTATWAYAPQAYSHLLLLLCGSALLALVCTFFMRETFKATATAGKR